MPRTLPSSEPAKIVSSVRFDAQKRAGHEHHLHVAQAHAFAPAQAEIRLGNEPQNPLPAAAPKKRIRQRQDRRGRREREQVIGDEQRGSVGGLGEQAEHERQAQAGEIHGIGRIRSRRSVNTSTIISAEKMAHLGLPRSARRRDSMPGRAGRSAIRRPDTSRKLWPCRSGICRAAADS